MKTYGYGAYPITCLNGSFGPTQDDVYRALEQVEHEMAALAQKKAGLLTCLNHFAPISKLPAELLLEIFRNCMPVDNDVATNDREKMLTSPSWLAFSRVCRSWRKLALEHQSLWVRPVFKCPSLAQIMLDRAGDLPLEVVLWDSIIPDSYGSFYYDWFGLLVGTGRSKHIRVLELHLPREIMQLSLADLSYAPALEQLYLKPCDGAQNINPVLRPPRIRAPRLQELELHSFPFPLFYDSFSNLTRLVINQPERRVSVSNLTLRVDHVLDILREASSLRFVELVNALSPSGPLGSLARLVGSVRVPSLEVLNVVDDWERSGALDLLSCLSVPNLRKFFINLDICGDSSTPLGDIEHIKLALAQIKSFSSRCNCASWRALSLDGFADDWIELRLGTSSLCTPYPRRLLRVDTRSPIDGEWRMDFHIQPAIRMDFLEQLRALLQPERIEALYVYSIPNGWEIFGTIPTLSHVMFEESEEVRQLLNFCRRDTLSQLSEIYLAFEVSESNIETLVEVLGYCMAAGVPLQKLYLEHDDLDPIKTAEVVTLWNRLQALGLQIIVSEAGY